MRIHADCILILWISWKFTNHEPSTRAIRPTVKLANTGNTSGEFALVSSPVSSSVSSLRLALQFAEVPPLDWLHPTIVRLSLAKCHSVIFRSFSFLFGIFFNFPSFHHPNSFFDSYQRERILEFSVIFVRVSFATFPHQIHIKIKSYGFDSKLWN